MTMDKQHVPTHLRPILAICLLTQIVLSYYSRPFIFHFIKDFLSPSSFCKILSGGAHMLEIVALEREDLRNFPVGLGENINEI